MCVFKKINMFLPSYSYRHPIIPTYVYLGILVYMQLVYAYLFGYLLPPTNGINFDSSIAIQNC